MYHNKVAKYLVIVLQCKSISSSSSYKNILLGEVNMQIDIASLSINAIEKQKILFLKILQQIIQSINYR